MSKHLIAAALTATLLAGCGGGGGAAPGPLPPTSTQVTASVAGPPVLVTLGDSITAGFAATNRDTQGYAALLASALGAQLTNLGVATQTACPTPALTSTGGLSQPATKGVLATQVPAIPLNATIVTLYIGTNDIWAEAVAPTLPDDSNIAALYPQATTTIDGCMTAIVAGIRARVPAARIFVATVPNWAYTQEGLTWAPQIAERDALTTLADQMKSTVMSLGVGVVDLMCDPASYDPANYPPGSGSVHPDDAGHAALAADFLAQIQHPTPTGHCIYESGP